MREFFRMLCKEPTSKIELRSIRTSSYRKRFVYYDLQTMSPGRSLNRLAPMTFAPLKGRDRHRSSGRERKRGRRSHFAFRWFGAGRRAAIFTCNKKAIYFKLSPFSRNVVVGDDVYINNPVHAPILRRPIR
jgi:hypothetical protein